jgi:cytochrome c1
MKKLIILLIALSPLSLLAAGGGLSLPNDKLPRMSHDALIVSQQKGMQIYMNNCMGCHALSFQRYKRTAEDLKIPEDIMLENLIFSDAKIGDLMVNNMPKKAAAKWFGAAPPDLSVVARARGVDWLYNYFRGFYKDDSRTYGVNNSVFKDVGMPHALEYMQGLQVKTEEVKALEKAIESAKEEIAAATKKQEDGDNSSDLDDIIDASNKIIYDSEKGLVKLANEGKFFSLITKGQLEPAEFDLAMADLVRFLDYVGEPIKQERKRLGIWVLLFIAIFGIFAYLLKKEYWKDIH